jgi:hypothetical protein
MSSTICLVATKFFFLYVEGNEVEQEKTEGLLDSRVRKFIREYIEIGLTCVAPAIVRDGQIDFVVTGIEVCENDGAICKYCNRAIEDEQGEFVELDDQDILRHVLEHLRSD